MHQWGKYRLLSGCGITEELYRKRENRICSKFNRIKFNNDPPKKNFLFIMETKRPTVKMGKRYKQFIGKEMQRA